MEESKLKHLELVQGVITRMNSNSFSIKTWAITILAAFLAMYASGDEQNNIYLLAAAVPTFVFWFLDAYYLRMERKYRKLYDDVIAGKVNDLEMKIKLYKESYLSALFSLTEAGLYLTLIIGLIIAYFIMH
jgi:hypothetical protein